MIDIIAHTRFVTWSVVSSAQPWSSHGTVWHAVFTKSFTTRRSNDMRRLLRRTTFTLALSAAAAGFAVSLTTGAAQASTSSLQPLNAGGAASQVFCFKLPLFGTIHCYYQV